MGRAKLDVGIKDLQFRIYTDEEIEKISVLKITNHESISALGHYEKDGVYDLRLGPMSPKDPEFCETCGSGSYHCPGHCGHIDLPLPVYNPFFYDQLKQLISNICSSCHRFQATPDESVRFTFQLKFLNAGFIEEALAVPNLITSFANTDSNNEAIEVNTGIENEYKDNNNSLELGRVLRSLTNYYNKTIKEMADKAKISLHTNTIRQEILKKFLNERKKKKCLYCFKGIIKYNLQNSRFMIAQKKAKNSKDDVDDDLDGVVSSNQSYISVEQTETIIKNCWKNDSGILKIIYRILDLTEKDDPSSIFFMHKILVAPPKYRPCNVLRGRLVENETSVLFKNIVRQSKLLSMLVATINKLATNIPEEYKFQLDLVQGKTPVEKMQNTWIQLQANVDAIYDSDMNKLHKLSMKGIRQVLEKKEGLMRTNLMGKRVDFSARSVAAPDPMLSVDEVGVPMDFAKRLSYPVPVTAWNVNVLRELVMNGPLVYPGAVSIEDEEGKKIRLSPTDIAQRRGIANKLLTPPETHVKKVNMFKIVYRHLEDGDYVLMNRQPTLHRPSIQAHRAHVMAKDRVLRMPYANCKAYNADFDGDEMNLHFPQNELARSEAKYIITTKNQYLTPKDGSPLAGLIQDCVVAGVMLTMRGKFFNRADYQQLVFTALADSSNKIHTIPPAIMKPTPLWSGKQVFSTILKNIIPKKKAAPSFNFKTNVKVKLWEVEEPRKARGGGDVGGKRENMSESEFVMRDGELLCGVVDKCAIGSSSFGLVHTCYELYGGDIATRLLSSINRLCVYYLQWSGHTISSKEFITRDATSKHRRKRLSELVKNTPKLVHEKLGLSSNIPLQDYMESVHMSGSEKDMAMIDGAFTHVLNPTVSNVTEENEEGLLRRSLDNHMRMMVDTGSKGSKINMNQMASLFGSVAIDGKRMPMGITGKTLPSFQPYEVDPRSGGFIPRRFMTGVTVQNYFFLCIVGRDSLQHTAVKTANSGYMQRCLIKHLEGISVKYDSTVRNSDGLVLQFEYGEDGLDVSRVPFFRSNETMDTLVNNYSRLYDKKTIKIASSTGVHEKVENYKSSISKWTKKNKNSNYKSSAFQKFCDKLPSDVKEANNLTETNCNISKSHGRPETSVILQNLWHQSTIEERRKCKKYIKRPDPVCSVFCADSNLGVISEAMEDLIDNYYTKHYTKLSAHEQLLGKKKLYTTFHMKTLNSRVNPGEAVGALCAQAIGEPLTQMTLNTFHFAGRDELNVTLGVPRMVEILRTASENISTPIMEIPFLPHITPKQAEMLRLSFGSVTLSNVLHYVDVVEQNKVVDGNPSRCIKMKMVFLPYNQYRHKYYVKPSQILHYVENNFLTFLIKEIQKSMSMRVSTCGANAATGSDENKDLSNDVDAPKAAVQSVDLSDSEEEMEEENPDDVGLASSNRNKKVQEQDYSESEAENEDDAIDKAFAEMVSEDEALGDEITDEDFEEENVESNTTDASRQEFKLKQKVSDDEQTMRCNKVLSKNPWITNYKLDCHHQLWCEVHFALPFRKSKYDFSTLVRKSAENALVHCINNIKRAFVEDKNGLLLLRTEGINIYKMFEYNHLLDVNKLYTNNIVTVAKIFGIEAAQRSIIKEIRAVQAAYDIKVDFRHLSLLADYFTMEGVYKACSRFALSSCVSPLQKMTYETTIQFLKSALVHGELERMDSPSANVALGQPVKVGTNVMKIRPKLSLVACH